VDLKDKRENGKMRCTCDFVDWVHMSEDGV
jgi:hypothetical protein